MYWMVGNKGGRTEGESGSGEHAGRKTRMQSISLGNGLVPSRNYEKKDDKHIDEVFDKKVPSETPTESVFETWRLETTKFMAQSWFGAVYFNMFMVLSVISLLQYIAETYLDEESDVEALNAFSIVELVLAALFGADWCLSLFLASHRWEHFWSFFALVDLATVIPIFVTSIFFNNRVNYYDIFTFWDVINYAMYAASTLRILRALRLHRKLFLVKDEVQRFLSGMLLSVVTMILFDAAIIRYLELHEQQFSFHTWMYYVVVSISTVGYGDISPGTTLGRFAAMFIICFAIIFVPQQTNELIEKMGILSVYARRIYTPRHNTKHVVICGDLRTTFLREFFSELFHEDHENMNLNAVILQPDSPSVEMYSILRDPLFGLVVHYLEGSPLKNKDLIRAKVNLAVAVFIMGNKFSVKPDEDDAKTILQQFSLRRFIEGQSLDKDPLFCLQLIRPENRRHLGAQEDDDCKEIVVCLNEMKMGLLAKSCMFPGTSTFIFNLLTSFADNGEESDKEDEEDPRAVNASTGAADTANKYAVDEKSNTEEDTKKKEENDDDDEEKSKSSGSGSDSDNESEHQSIDTDSDASFRGGVYWMSEYQKGCDWEIYTTDVADVFEGMKFIDVAKRLYVKLGVILFALRVTDLNSVTKRVRVVLNPADFHIPPKSRYSVQGFVIAKNQASSDLSFTDAASGSKLEMITGAIGRTTSSVNSMLSGKRHSVARQAPGSGKEMGVGWQTLLASQHQAKKEEEMYQSRQERMQRMEDEYLRTNFFVRENGADLSECTIFTSIQQEYPFIKDHMIVIAKGLSNLYDFVRPLRAKYLGKLKHIVLLFPFDIPIHVWRRISIFEGILFVRGSPLEEADIKRCGVFRASQVVVLADPDASSSGDVSGMDALIDADAIFTYHCVKRLNEHAHIVIEIVRHQNVGYLDETTDADCDYKFTPNFAAGKLFTSSMLDAVVCQVFYNPQLITVLNKLISGTDHIEEPEGVKSQLLNEPTRSTVGLKSMQGSSLYQVPVPEAYVGKTYGKMFEHFASRDCLCFALLRGVFSNMTIGPCSNRMPYVYTNPAPDTKLYKCDKVFVLSQKVLTSSRTSIKEVIDNYMHANHSQSHGGAGSHRRGSNEYGSAEGDLSELSISQRTLERAVSALTVDVTMKFQEMIDMQKDLKAMLSKEGRSQPLQHSNETPSPIKPLVRSVSRTKIESALERRKQSMSSIVSITSGMRPKVHPGSGEGGADEPYNFDDHSNQDIRRNSALEKACQFSSTTLDFGGCMHRENQ